MLWLATLAWICVATTTTPRTAAGRPTNQAAVKELLRRANEAQRAEDYPKAATFWLQVYMRVPTQPMALYNAALMEERAGNLSEAARHLREFISVTTPQHPRHTLAKVRLEAVTAKMEAAEKSRLANRLLAERTSQAGKTSERRGARVGSRADKASHDKSAAGTGREKPVTADVRAAVRGPLAPLEPRRWRRLGARWRWPLPEGHRRL